MSIFVSWRPKEIASFFIRPANRLANLIWKIVRHTRPYPNTTLLEFLAVLSSGMREYSVRDPRTFPNLDANPSRTLYLTSELFKAPVLYHDGAHHLDGRTAREGPCDEWRKTTLTLRLWCKDGSHCADHAKESEPHTVRNTELQKNLARMWLDGVFENRNFFKYCLFFREAFTDPRGLAMNLLWSKGC